MSDKESLFTIRDKESSLSQVTATDYEYVIKPAVLKKAITLGKTHHSNVFGGLVCEFNVVKTFLDEFFENKHGHAVFWDHENKRSKNHIVNYISSDSSAGLVWDEDGTMVYIDSLNEDSYNILFNFFEKINNNVVETVGNIYMLTHSQSRGYGFDKLGSFRDQLIKDNYDSNVIKNIDHVMKDLVQSEPCGRVIIFDGPAGGGKALALETPIATITGWSTMGDLKIGDIVFGDDGLPCQVTYVSPTMIGNSCFKVGFSDGSYIIADAEHIWLTHTKKNRTQEKTHTDEWRKKRRGKRKKVENISKLYLVNRNLNRDYKIKDANPPTLKTTKEIFESLYDGKDINHSINVAGALELPDIDLPIEPYVLGLWLGNGDSHRIGLTTMDNEIKQKWEQWGLQNGCNYCREINYVNNKAKGYHLTNGLKGGNPILDKFKKLNLIKNKHIPAIYLRSSKQQRLSLLQGLMDTDGYASPKDGGCEFTTTSAKLRDGVLELALSLGIKANMREGRAKIKGRDCGPKWRMSFFTNLPIFSISRKIKNQKTKNFRGCHSERYIISVEPIDSTPVRCIAVSSPSHLFLAGRTLIPTHNTYSLRGMINEIEDAIFILVQPHSIPSLTDPDIIPALMGLRRKNKKPIVLVLEDADSVLVPRGIDNMNHIAVLLNFGEGLLGSALDLRVICTTNAKITEIDPAIVRDGRLCRRIHIDKLSIEQSNRIYSRLSGKQEIVFDKNKTLAEIYKLAKDNGIVISKVKQPSEIGFSFEKSDRKYFSIDEIIDS